MTRAYAIDVGDEQAGIVLPDQGGYLFVAAAGRFAVLSGRRFALPADAERAARQLGAAATLTPPGRSVDPA